MARTHQIQPDLANGMSNEKVIVSYLLAKDKEMVYTAAQELESAVTDYSKSIGG